ncbi:putative lipoprotein with Yx(FWY)xxD motif [Scopulibacillus darangshiensis]|uniref:Putative lipoprotein with Yx(FWY)xxD motif n=1 Tax=Scopulibacillus darangshiensis TaxID=442528 RepID=A0A4R2NIF9_9BACL|nr:putative lipoprotein with Yx(FWY)xxD motif [Scopulibacillus darangshiensis]
MKKAKLLFTTAIVMTMLFLAACGNSSEGGEKAEKGEKSSSNEKSPALQTLNNDKVGSYLADAKGMTLYVFKKDKKGVSNCKGECLKKWPVFYAKDMDMPEGYNKSDFGTITRKDTGKKQTTYKGYPLYYFFKDKAKGDIKGQGVKGVWYVVNDETFAKLAGDSGENATDLASGTDTVLADTANLKKTVEQSSKDTASINNAGKKLGEDWDAIEKKVEEKYPKDYENIEDSLYPLLAEAAKEQPDEDKMKKLIADVTNKLNSFKEKVSS